MPPALYCLYILISALFAVGFAEVVTLRASSAGRTSALANRPKSPIESRFLPPLSYKNGLSPASDHDLVDIVLVASVDGKFHGLNRTDGRTLWSMSANPSSTSISAPLSLSPLVKTSLMEYDPDLIDETTQQEVYVIEPQSGDLYVMSTPSGPLQRFPFSVTELVEMSPFSFSADEGGRRVFLGSKETSLLVLELETGKIKASFAAECLFDSLDNKHEDEEESEGATPPISRPREVYIGRTDYHLSIHSRPSSTRYGDSKPVVQNLTYSVYGPDKQYTLNQLGYRRAKDDAYIQSLPNGDLMAFKAELNRGNVKADSQLLWARSFDNPIVAIFDVLQDPDSVQPYVLLQPRPRLQDFFSRLDVENTANLPNFGSAYVGIIEETGSLYAMSPDQFPLVVFDFIPRPLLGIDPPPSTKLDSARDEIDSTIRSHKLREAQRERYAEYCHVSPSDRRCFVGLRSLVESEESRMLRLLESKPGRADVGLSTPTPSHPTAQPMEPPTINESMGGTPPIPSDHRIEDPSFFQASGRSVWEGVLLALVLGGVSLWFSLRRKSHIPIEDKSAALQPDQIPPQLPAIPSIPEIPPTHLISSAEVAAPLTPVTEPVEAGDESANEGEGDTDAPTAAGKRKPRRGKRGKKKKGGANGQAEDESEAQDNANTQPPPTSNPPSGGSEPAASSIIITSSPKAAPAPSLIVSETILGTAFASSFRCMHADSFIGFGSHGTVVYQGSLQGRSVAVKRLLQDFVTLAEREVSILQESDDHPNVIRYYYQEAHANFLYIALELCPASLADIIEQPDKDQFRDIAIAFDPKKALKQITSGLRHLHALKLVHRDIKPQNILISTGKYVGGKITYRMLISDFGLCKKLDFDQTSFLPTAHGAMAAGTVGWRAPEILRGDVNLNDLDDNSSMSSRGSTSTVTGGSSNTQPRTRLTKTVDIFALGCLFYYTLTNGGHPFGSRFEREVNIFKGEMKLDGLTRFGEEGVEAENLIARMLNAEARQRPDTTACLLHPYFWDAARRLNFLQDVSDRFENLPRDPKDPHLVELETDAFSIVGNDWQSRLDKTFIENLGKFRKYDPKSVQDLLRALRNKKNHYQDLPDNVKRHLGPMPDGFLAYFTKRYPKLFLHVHSVIASSALRTESMFRSYFELPES
ncbi:hypothetical protein BDN72DRAFT_885694 [Pluteus cervinus]|uniref:Uncharacterized protein n=1 Tax=Pluteus cervinus TaxID=181527 RepID=A0ACD3BCL1_9AGAR|nr:hypothetical protein BDN72DRAFT_885694 [Pluteus cervinus]